MATKLEMEMVGIYNKSARKARNKKAKTAWIWFIGAVFLAYSTSSLLLGVVAFGLFIRAIFIQVENWSNFS